MEVMKSMHFYHQYIQYFILRLNEITQRMRLLQKFARTAMVIKMIMLLKYTQIMDTLNSLREK